MRLTSKRAGILRKTKTGYEAYIPRKLNPAPDIQFDTQMCIALSLANRKLGRLEGIVEILPNPDLFLSMYVRKEAVLSSQIEGTQASLIDVLNVEQDDSNKKDIEVEDVVNYVKAVKYGISRLDTLPLSLRLIREIHEVLLQGVRGSERNPGQFRTSQNWIGEAGSTLATASFVPPPVPEMNDAMEDLEMYLHAKDDLPDLVRIAIVHAQFETIHPFLDGNGRMGRLLITFLLCQKRILSKPLLYLSYFFKEHRSEYYERLMNVRFHGDWEGWILFFLRGVASVADESVEAARAIISLKNEYSQLLNERIGTSGNHMKLLDILFDYPIFSRTLVMEKLGITSPTSGNVIKDFLELGIIVDQDITRKRNKKYRFVKYLEILQKGTEISPLQ